MVFSVTSLLAGSRRSALRPVSSTPVNAWNRQRLSKLAHWSMVLPLALARKSFCGNAWRQARLAARMAATLVVLMSRVSVKSV
ncbi:hypothetical protein D3C71_1179430 [compost metagenome]